MHDLELTFQLKRSKVMMANERSLMISYIYMWSTICLLYHEQDMGHTSVFKAKFDIVDLVDLLTYHQFHPKESLCQNRKKLTLHSFCHKSPC